MTDPGLRFWLQHVEAGGGLWEPAGDGVLVVLPPELGQRYRLAEELVVTDDPDVARCDGVTFLGTGHPVLAEAAESVLSGGDAGVVLLGWAGPAPAEDVLEEHARAEIPVSHGRIDATGKARPVIHWVVRVGVMVSYAVSTEDRFSERLERWVHVSSRREVPDAVVARLASAVSTDDEPLAGLTRPVAPAPADDLVRALAEADRLIEAAALRRQSQLARQLDDAHGEERERATSYYADAIAGIERRLDAASPDRRALLEARLVSTREERTRRLAEIAEKYQAHHETRPYRLHVVGVPALRLPVDVRRGERRYPMELDWLRPAGVFAQPRCPSCESTAPLVAGKNALGCLQCLVSKAPAAPPAPAPAARPGPAPDAPPPANGPGQARTKPTPATASPTATTRAKATAAQSSRGPVSPRQPATSARPRQPQAPPAKASQLSAATPKRAEKLVATLWQAVADGHNRHLRDVIAPDSPAAALHTLYGTDGIKHALAVPGHETPEAFTSSSSPSADGWGSTNGTLRTAHNEYPYLLRWRAEHSALAVVEVLPFPLYPDGRFHAYYWMFADRSPYRITRIQPSASRLDDVAQLLLRTGGRWQGLAVAARALAAWWRLPEQHDDLLAAYPPAILAAAVHRLVALRAGDKGLFRQAAEAYQTDEAAVRRADAQLRKLLALGPGQAW